MIPNFHIIGIQGSGKGTQSSLLVERFKFNYLPSGNIFRERAQVDDEVGREMLAAMKLGQLLSLQQLTSMVDYYLSKNEISVALIGDGVIRTVEQNMALTKLWHEYDLDEPILIHLILNEEEALKRIENRKSQQDHPNLHEYHKVYSGKLINRVDDNQRAIHERFKLFHELTQPVINQFKAQNRCYDFDASKSVEEVHAEISELLLSIYPEIEVKNVVN